MDETIFLNILINLVKQYGCNINWDDTDIISKIIMIEGPIENQIELAIKIDQLMEN